MMTGKKKILITESENFSPEAISSLKQYFDVEALQLKSKSELLVKIQDADIIFVRLGFTIDKEIIQHAPNLKYILTATTGLDHIDTAYFERNGGTIISLKNEFEFLSGIPSTAEHTWALLLALIKKVPSAAQHVKNGKWNRDLFIGNNAKGKKLGILGLGRVGKQVGKFAEAFEMDIGFFDIESIGSAYQKFDSPAALFSWADIISIHIPLNEQNIHFVNKELIDVCKTTALLINTSRGAIWNENDIANSIKENRISGVATDVLENELDKSTIASNPLVTLANEEYNVIITPHIAGATFESMRMTEVFVAEKFLKYHALIKS